MQLDNSSHGEHGAGASPDAAGQSSNVAYTCPMHPQIRQMGPGNCPICGMALEPVLATAQTGDSPELRDMSRRFWVGLALTVPVFALEMGADTLLSQIVHMVAAAQRSRAPIQRMADEVAGCFVAQDGRLAGFVAIADPIKPTTRQALEALRGVGVRIVMLTGDGVNDAPALAAAEVGIAMGTGTDVAMESSGVTLLKGDLMGIVRARKLSQMTMRNIRQNLFLSFAYNVAGIPLAAGVLYPFTGLLLSPVVAAAAMALSSVSVIANALRLRSSKLES